MSLNQRRGAPDSIKINHSSIKKIKKLLTVIAFFVVSTVVLHAQDNKPTKEETIAFLVRTLKEVKGRNLPYAWGVLENASFKDNSIEYYTHGMLFNERLWDNIITYEDLRWDRFKEMVYQDFDSHPTKSYHIIFSVNHTHKFEYTSINQSNASHMDEKIETGAQSNLILFVPEDKAESFKKAILRLVEIAKEENKDPFAN